ncbi:glycoside hydrolase family 16 protein [Peniophora sp. CONT]|nr:glycoside hydrolase family 16 protein [Peniophora sp. CONT]
MSASSGSSHPGPMHYDGTYVGRAAPEIDIFEALGTDAGGNVSQSGQYAPFNWAYEWPTDGNLVIPDASVTALNPYAGGAYQQAISALSLTNSSCWELTDACYAVYGIEYSPGFDNAYTSWINNGKLSWTLLSGGLVADNKSEIAARPIPQEPMYIIFNLGLSTSFVTIDYDDLTLPATLSVDYVRVYQDPDNINVGCDPDDFPTADYISTYNEAYSNPNYTLWSDIGESYPGNSFLGEC